MIVPTYHCERCGREWPFALGPVACPFCGNVYIRWADRTTVAYGDTDTEGKRK